jgi:hypothetical protein
LDRRAQESLGAGRTVIGLLHYGLAVAVTLAVQAMAWPGSVK